jgi:hypothetical protein
VTCDMHVKDGITAICAPWRSARFIAGDSAIGANAVLCSTRHETLATSTPLNHRPTKG